MATNAKYFLSEELLETIPPTHPLPHLYHIALNLDMATARSLCFLCLPCFRAVPTVWPQYSAQTSELVFSDKSIHNNMEYSADSFIPVPEYMWWGIFLVQKLALKRIQMELHSPKTMFFVVSFNAKSTRTDERFWKIGFFLLILTYPTKKVKQCSDTTSVYWYAWMSFPWNSYALWKSNWRFQLDPIHPSHPR